MCKFSIQLLLFAVLGASALLSQMPSETKKSDGTAKAGDAQKAATVTSPADVNALSPQEREEGWRLLFDGKSFAGWRSFRKSDIVADRWVVEDGCLHLLPRTPEKRNGGDLITTETFANFEFAFEWMAADGANSGVKYLIDEYFAPNRYPVSFEYQIQVERDVANAKRKPIHTTGALYDMIPAAGGVYRPEGAFNESKIVVKGMTIEHWLNGEKVLEFNRASAPFRELVANSKFRRWPGFGLNTRGHIGLQDHGNEIWFRRIRVRSLAPKDPEPALSAAVK